MTIDNAEWGRRFVARIVLRSGASEEAARMTLDAVDMVEWREDFDEDPEGAAEEEMSNWDDDNGDEPEENGNEH